MFPISALSARVRALLALGLLAVPALAQSAGNSMDLTMPTLKAAPTSTAPLALKVTAARVVAVPPGIEDTSVFVTLTNAGNRPVVLTSAQTAVAAHAMLMLTVKDAQGLTGMKATPSLTVPAHGRLVLDDIGPHIMLMGLKRSLKPGEVVTVILRDRAGHTLSIRAPVRKP